MRALSSQTTATSPSINAKAGTLSPSSSGPSSWDLGRPGVPGALTAGALLGAAAARLEARRARRARQVRPRRGAGVDPDQSPASPSRSIAVAASKLSAQPPEQWAELEHAVAQLKAENSRLRAELEQEQSRRGSDGGEDATPSASSAESEAAADGPGGESPFYFPTVDLPRQLEFVRIVAPGVVSSRESCGDWLSLFRNAAPYIASFRGGIVVVHVPSFLLEESQRECFKGIMEDVAFCSLLGLRTILVTSVETRLWKRLQDSWGEPRVPEAGATKVGNRLPGLVIDEHALRIAKQEAGFARVEVEGALSAGFEKRSLSGSSTTSAGIFSLRSTVSVVSSTNFFTASPLGVRNGVDFGYAGVVRSVNVELLERQLGEGDIVSLMPLGTSPNGEVFYVSSEELAATVARRIRALKLVYITRGQRITDVRHNRVVPGLQHHDAEALLESLDNGGRGEYPQEVQDSEWFSDFIRQMRLLVKAVSPKGVRRGHLVDPTPGSLLQEFYTTDGSGTCVAQDLYQGLGRAKLADASCILALLREDWEARELPGEPPTARLVEEACGAGEFFVWKRDEAVLGCAQLTAHTQQPASGSGTLLLFAEMRHFALVERLFQTHATALFGYAERAAVEGSASALLCEEYDAERRAWLTGRGFRGVTAAEAETLPEGVLKAVAGGPLGAGSGLLLKPLGAGAAEEAQECLEAFTEEQRMWGGLAA